MSLKRPPKPKTHFLTLMASDDRGTPSSSRVIGTVIFACLSLVILAIYTVLLVRIATITDSASLGIVTNALIKFDWVILIMSATALSLYGINVWKYIAQIRAGGFLNDQMQNLLMRGNGMSGYSPFYPNGNSVGGYGGMGGFSGGWPTNTNVLPGGLPSPVVPIANRAVTGNGGSTGTLVVPTVKGSPVEPYTDPVPPPKHTTEAGVGSDE